MSAGRSPEQGADAGDEHREGEGLGQEIVGARYQAPRSRRRCRPWPSAPGSRPNSPVPATLGRSGSRSGRAASDRGSTGRTVARSPPTSHRRHRVRPRRRSPPPPTHASALPRSSGRPRRPEPSPDAGGRAHFSRQEHGSIMFPVGIRSTPVGFRRDQEITSTSTSFSRGPFTVTSSTVPMPRT